MARKLSFDRWLFAAVLMLVGLGLVMVYSASMVFAGEHSGVNPIFLRQAGAAAVGLVAMLVVMHLD